MILVLLCNFFNFSLGDTRSFYLDQVDQRHRLSYSIKIPQTIRLRVRPSYEYRYKTTTKNKLTIQKVGSAPLVR